MAGFSRASFKQDWGKKIEESKSKPASKTVDPRFWSPDVATGAEYTIIARLLPSPDTALPYADTGHHYFEGLDGYYNEKCPNSSGYGFECPACQYAFDKARFIKGAVTQEDKDANRANSGPFQAKRARYWQFVVLRDNKNPDNVGKIFLFNPKGKFQKDVIDSFITNSAENFGKTVYPWDIDEGVNIRIVAFGDKYTGNAFTGYDKSNFVIDDMDPNKSVTSLAAVVGGAEKEEVILNSLYSLNDFIKKENFKSKAELTEIFNKVMCIDPNAPKTTEVKTETKVSTKKAKAEVVEEEDPIATAFDIEDDKDDEDFWAEMK